MSLDVNLSEPDEFNCMELHSVIKKVAKLKDIDDFSYHVNCISGKGESYIANTFRVVIKESDNDENNFKVIVKTLVNTVRQELFHELHVREASVYKKIIPVFNKIQKGSNIEDKVILPECLLSSTEYGNEILILEDLQDDGWEVDMTLKNFEDLDYEIVSVVIKELAKLHALSFIYEKGDPNTFAQLKIQFGDIIFQEKFLNKSQLRNYFQDSFDSSLKLISDDNIRKKLEAIKPRLLDILREYTKPVKYNVFCHGDCWMNNILFKFEDGRPIGACFLDFQALRYANPVTDIIYFIYLCTTPNFRSEYFDKVINDYHVTLTSFLKACSIEVNSVYPLEDFLNDVDSTLPYGLIIAITELKIVTLTPEHEAILKGASTYPGADLTKVPGEDKLLRMRLNDVVKESIDNGVFNKLLNKI